MWSCFADLMIWSDDLIIFADDLIFGWSDHVLLIWSFDAMMIWPDCLCWWCYLWVIIWSFDDLIWSDLIWSDHLYWWPNLLVCASESQLTSSNWWVVIFITCVQFLLNEKWGEGKNNKIQQITCVQFLLNQKMGGGGIKNSTNQSLHIKSFSCF